MPDLFARRPARFIRLRVPDFKQKLMVSTLLATKLLKVPDLYATIHKGVRFNRAKIPKSASFLATKCLRVPDLFKRKWVPGSFAAKFLRMPLRVPEKFMTKQIPLRCQNYSFPNV